MQLVGEIRRACMSEMDENSLTAQGRGTYMEWRNFLKLSGHRWKLKCSDKLGTQSECETFFDNGSSYSPTP